MYHLFRKIECCAYSERVFCRVFWCFFIVQLLAAVTCHLAKIANIFIKLFHIFWVQKYQKILGLKCLSWAKHYDQKKKKIESRYNKKRLEETIPAVQHNEISKKKKICKLYESLPKGIDRVLKAKGVPHRIITFIYFLYYNFFVSF